LFVHGDMRRWVAWTADGTFAHGIYGGERLVGYQQNGTAMAPTGTWLGFDQAYRLFHDPEAVAGVLGDESGWPDLARDTAVDTLFDGLELPSLEVVAYCALDEVPRDLVARGIVLQGPVQLAAPLPSPGGAEDACVDVADAPADRAPGLTRTLNLPAGTHALRVRLDIEDRAADLAVVDALVDGRNVGRVEPPRGADRVADRLTVERVVPVPADDATLVFRARRRDGVAADSAPLTLRVDRSPAAPLAAADQAAAAPVAPEEDARLFMLIVGVDAYGGPITPLKFAVADASTFGRVVAQAKADVYDEIETIELVDSAATRDAVIDALRRIASEARAGDAVLIYLAGHGVTSDETGYVFVTVDVTDPATVGSSGLDQATLADLLAEIPAENVMVLLDTCYAGAFDLKQPANLAQESGYFVLTGSSSVEAALDSYNGENGVLAFAVKQGLTGQAASPDGRIDALQLGVYARRTVPELAAEKNHRQSAVFKAAGGDLKEFPITTVSKSGG